MSYQVDINLNQNILSIEEHLHSWERWCGAAVVPDAELHVCDVIGTTSTPFVMDAGNDTWGSWLQIVGSDDTPIIAGKLKFDLHRLFVASLERGNAIHLIQIGFGSSGAAALAAGTYTDLVYKPQSNVLDESPIEMRVKRQDAGTKVWARVWVIGQNTGTIDFFHGIHEYEI